MQFILTPTKGFQGTIEANERVPTTDGNEGYRLLLDLNSVPTMTHSPILIGLVSQTDRTKSSPFDSIRVVIFLSSENKVPNPMARFFHQNQ